MTGRIFREDYKRFIKLLEKWPVDKTKSGRDIGELFRQQIKVLASETTTDTSLNICNLNAQIDSLERLANNTYSKKYNRVYSSSATGLSAEVCAQVLSSESLQNFNEIQNKKE